MFINSTLHLTTV